MTENKKRWGPFGEIGAEPQYVPASARPAIKNEIDPDDPLAWPRAKGGRDGAEWSSARAALEAEGVTVKLVTPARMARMRGLKPGADRCAAWYVLTDWPENPTVYVDATLSAIQQELSMAHELAHLHHSTWSEDQAEAYAQGFVGAMGRDRASL